VAPAWSGNIATAIVISYCLIDISGYAWSGDMRTFRMREVFVPGGSPVYTYVAREEFRLEERLRSASDNLCKLVTVTGPTKSGKSVLTQRVYPRDQVVWLDGGTIGNEDEIWSEIVRQLDGFTGVTSTAQNATSASISAVAKAQLKLPFIASAEGGLTPTIGTNRSDTSAVQRSDTPKNVAISLLRESKRTLVIDDFHYLTREQQGTVIRALKSLIFEGNAVIVLAIPHRRYDAIRVEKEMTGRVEQIEIPDWQQDELQSIPAVGFDLLNINAPDSITSNFSNESLSSPHLMQEFCRHICDANSIEKTCSEQFDIPPDTDLKPLFKQVAMGTSKIVFDRLAKGPRQRSDRKKRRFVDGSSGDIYVAVLRAIALNKPGMTSIEYEDIRIKLRELLDDDLPDAQQVSRVIEKMAEISATDQASTPVLDWDKEERRLHITDPFFAFFLKWGLSY
jgi:hypothetical protein